METTSIRLPIRNLPEHFDRSRITTILDEIECALMDNGGVYGKTFADSFTITIEVPTHQLMDTASCLKDLGLIYLCCPSTRKGSKNRRCRHVRGFSMSTAYGRQC